MSLSFKSFVHINEEHAAPHITMTLQQVIDAGKITNTVQAVIMSQLLTAMKSSDVGSVRNLNEFPAFSSSAIESIKKLPAEDQVHVAQELLAFASIPFEIKSGCPDPTANTNSWVASVLQHQH